MGVHPPQNGGIGYDPQPYFHRPKREPPIPAMKIPTTLSFHPERQEGAGPRAGQLGLQRVGALLQPRQLLAMDLSRKRRPLARSFKGGLLHETKTWMSILWVDPRAPCLQIG